jgi:hypothetical protein
MFHNWGTNEHRTSLVKKRGKEDGDSEDGKLKTEGRVTIIWFLHIVKRIRNRHRSIKNVPFRWRRFADYYSYVIEGRNRFLLSFNTCCAAQFWFYLRRNFNSSNIYRRQFFWRISDHDSHEFMILRRIIDRICWAYAISRSIPTDGQTDRRTDELIRVPGWAG